MKLHGSGAPEFSSRGLARRMFETKQKSGEVKQSYPQLVGCFFVVLEILNFDSVGRLLAKTFLQKGRGLSKILVGDLAVVQKYRACNINTASNTIFVLHFDVYTDVYSEQDIVRSLVRMWYMPVLRTNLHHKNNVGARSPLLGFQFNCSWYT